MIPKDIKAKSIELGVRLPEELFDFIKVMNYGATKYAPNNWLEVDGTNSDHKSMIASTFRHVAEASTKVDADHETGLDPLLHAATRCLMLYVRKQRNLVHEKDM